MNFVRESRIVLKNLNEMLAALRLGHSTTWRQLFTDGTARRQIAFQNLVIAVMEQGKLEPVLVSSCMVLESETSDNQVKSIMDMVSYELWRRCDIVFIIHLLNCRFTLPTD